MGLRDKYIDAINRAAAAGDTQAANELAAYVDANMPSAEMLRQQDFDSMPWYQKAGIGFDQAVTDLGTGIKTVLGGDTAQAKADSEMVDSVDSGWKTAGNVAGDIAMASLPGLGATSMAARQGLPLATRAAAGLGGEAWGAGVVEGLQNNDLLTGAAAAATTAVVGGGVPKMLGIGSKAADDLAEQGVNLTPGQRWGGIVQGVEEIMSYIPGFSKPVQKARERALTSWNQVMRGSKKAPQEAIGDIKAAVKAEYDDIFEGVTKLDDSLFNSWATTLNQASDVMPPKEFKQLEKLFANISDPIARGRGSIDSKALQSLDQNLGKLQNQAYRRGDSIAGDVYKSAKESLRQAMPEGMSSRLAQNNKAYGEFKVLESVTAKAAPMKRQPPGTFYPAEGLTSAAAGRRPLAAQGRAPLQKQLETANEVIRKENAAQGLIGRVPALTRPILNRGTQAIATSPATAQAMRSGMGIGAGSMMSDLLDPNDAQDKMRLIAEELRRRR